jgi:Transposase IS116/IS110/IS902 family
VHNGRAVKRTGDGSIIEFRSVVDAVRCAIEVQNGMVDRNAGLPPERRIELGLTPAKHQSGERDQTGGISRCGDEMMRMMLYEAAQVMLMRSVKWSWLKAWAMKIAKHRGLKKALARRLAVIMHRIWVDGTEFRWTREVTAT